MILETKRLFLRELEQADFDSLCKNDWAVRTDNAAMEG